MLRYVETNYCSNLVGANGRIGFGQHVLPVDRCYGKQNAHAVKEALI